MRRNGKIGSWNDDKGYGFILSSNGDPPVFIHINAFRHRNRRPATDDVVTYILSRDKRGRPRASSAYLGGDERARPYVRVGSLAAIVSSIGFLLVVAGSVLATGLPVWVLVVYLLLSVMTFAAYAADKSAAQRRLWRTSEVSLHWLALLGGWPGAMVAQQMLRHKTSKQAFRTVYWGTVILNCAVFAGVHTSDGHQWLELLTESGATLVMEIPEYFRQLK